MPIVAAARSTLLDAFGQVMLYTSMCCAIVGLYAWYKQRKKEEVQHEK